MRFCFFLLFAVFAANLNAKSLLSWSRLEEIPSDAGRMESFRATAGVSISLNGAVCINTPYGLLVLGGIESSEPSSGGYLLGQNAEGIKKIHHRLPDMPFSLVNGSAAIVGDILYVAGGQSGARLDSVMNNLWSLDLSEVVERPQDSHWNIHAGWPGPARAFNVTVAQHNGFETCLYVIGGRYADESGAVQFLSEVYEFDLRTESWRRRADIPSGLVPTAGVSVGQSHLYVFGTDAVGAVPREGMQESGVHNQLSAYHTITDTWVAGEELPFDSQVTSAEFQGDSLVVFLKGYLSDPTRSIVWAGTFDRSPKSTFGVLNYTVLGVYLASLVGVGFFFMKRNRNTDDYFRGGQKIPFWVAGCSIFATMLSSITFMAIPAKAYAQDWVFFPGMFMSFCVAPLAVYLALPFFRRIDATSAYEYLEKRFNRPVRLVGSGLFTFFHLFRMGIVLSLAGLALATFTPFSPVQAVLLMGVLCLVYSTLGGLVAVVWTDTIQTFVLLGGALLCFFLAVFRVDGGLAGLVQIASADHKLHSINWDFSGDSWMSMAIWVVVLGGIGQNISSYVADQSVVQRYMSTSDLKSAAKSIWTNALLVIPSAFLFFGMGTALYAFYKSNPGLLDPLMNTDQIFPLFITTQVPAGLAGLIVAGIFAAAQSTISTSMNSTATTVVTDFMRPFNLCRSEQGYFNASRILNFVLGGLGTLLGLFFVHPAITSLFDSFIMILGLFMGVLGGIFLLGMLTQKANGPGALFGAVIAVAVLLFLREHSRLHWFLYAAVGIVICFLAGYLLSFCCVKSGKDLAGLTIHTLTESEEEEK